MLWNHRYASRVEFYPIAKSNPYNYLVMGTRRKVSERSRAPKRQRSYVCTLHILILIGVSICALPLANLSAEQEKGHKSYIGCYWCHAYFKIQAHPSQQVLRALMSPVFSIYNRSSYTILLLTGIDSGNQFHFLDDTDELLDIRHRKNVSKTW